jgi:two-component system sensor histidine kinase UhpB
MVARLEAERRDSAGRALAAQESERLRIAQELHDEVGQKLTAVMLQPVSLSAARG